MTDATAALWTAVAAGGGAAIAGLVAVVVTTRQVRSSENLAKDARHQDRILRAYLTLIRYADDSISAGPERPRLAARNAGAGPYTTGPGPRGDVVHVARM